MVKTIMTTLFVSSMRPCLTRKLDFRKLIVVYFDESGLLKKLERDALEYEESVKQLLGNNDETISWIPPFRFILSLDLLFMQSGNYDKLVHLLISEPEQAIQRARDVVLCSLKQIIDIGKVKMTETDVEIEVQLTGVPIVMLNNFSKTSARGLISVRGILTAKSTTVKYARSSVYVCTSWWCTFFNYGERRRRPGCNEFCRHCHEPLQELVQFRDVGEEVMCKFIQSPESHQRFEKFFYFTAKVIDELCSVTQLELGKEYNLVGKVEMDLALDVWHISNNSFCGNLDQNIRKLSYGSTPLPRFISELFLSVGNYCKRSPWAFVIAISSQLGGNMVPVSSFIHLKVALMLSLATQSSSETPVHVFGIGRDTSTVQKLFRCAGRLAERYVSYSADFAHLGGTIKRGCQAGAVWQEAGAMILGTDGVCNLGDWSKFKKHQSDYVSTTLEKGEIVLTNRDSQHNNLTHSVPLKCSVWSYFNLEKKIDSRLRLKSLTEVFGMLFPIDETSEFEVEKICNHQFGNQAQKDGFRIPDRELKEYMRLVKSQHSLPIRQDASDLIKNYFVASRKDRPDSLPVGGIKTITTLSEAHAKLALRTQVLFDDVVAALYWYEEAATALYGPTGFDFGAGSMQIGKRPFYLAMNERIHSFKVWLTGYLDAFSVNVD